MDRANPDPQPEAPAAEVEAVPAADVVLEPLADFPHIDLRTPGEPWEKRRAAGKGLRAKVPHDSHGPVPVPKDRPDPVRLIEAAQAGRQERLIPLRVARMASSPFPSCGVRPPSWPGTSPVRRRAASTW